MVAIVYTSNTGNTERYARLLGEKTGLPCYSMQNAPELSGDVIYMGWVMAGSISGLAEAQKSFNVKAVCAVGMFPESSHKMVAELKEKNALEVPLFYLPGGFDLKKLSGMYRMMMGMIVKKMKSELGKKEGRTEADEKALEMFTKGCYFVDESHLAPVVEAVNSDQ